MSEKKNNKALVITISTVIALAGVIGEVLGTIQWSGYFDMSPELAMYLISFIATLYYVLFGYKKPHGDLLRYTLILLAVTCLNGAINAAITLASGSGFDSSLLLYVIGLEGFSILLISYVAGRLDKIKKNYFTMIMITVVQIIKSIISTTLYSSWSNFIFILWCFSTCLLWIDIMVAYIIRYREHKEAGVEDKQK